MSKCHNQAQLPQARDMLQQQVQQRTGELEAANQRLRQEIVKRTRQQEQAAQHQAELAHVARLTTMGEMASGLAHELNQPLTAIANFVHGALRRLDGQGYDDQAVLHALRQVAVQAERAGQIIRHMRQFIRKRAPCRAPMKVNKLARRVVAMLEPEARQRQVRVTLELQPDLPAAMGDAIQIEQVILNLVRNAFDALSHTPAEHRCVIVRTRLDQSGRVYVEVQDQGKGVSPEQAELIFNPFFTTRPQGMGMGLAIARSLIESHEGRLWLQPGTPAGAMFCFYLPAAHPESQTQDRPG